MTRVGDVTYVLAVIGNLLRPELKAYIETRYDAYPTIKAPIAV